MESSSDKGVRELLAVLSQGISVKARSLRSRNFEIQDLLFWFDPDDVRLCVDKARPTLKDRYKRAVISRGAYVRDLSCFRIPLIETQGTFRDLNDEASLEMIATEDAFIITFPDAKTRDWILVRLDALLAAIIGPAEIAKRQSFRRISPSPQRGSFTQDTHGVEELEELEDVEDRVVDVLDQQLQITRGMLKIGMQLKLHVGGRVLAGVLQLEEKGTSTPELTVTASGLRSVTQTPPTDPYNFSVFALFSRLGLGLSNVEGPLPIPLCDVVEVRSGSFTKEFVLTHSEGKGDGSCLCIIGAQAALSLELPGRAARDALQTRLSDYFAHHSSSSSSSSSSSW